MYVFVEKPTNDSLGLYLVPFEDDPLTGLYVKTVVPGKAAARLAVFEPGTSCSVFHFFLLSFYACKWAGVGACFFFNWVGTEEPRSGVIFLLDTKARLGAQKWK